jgi:hypothetical protein
MLMSIYQQEELLSEMRTGMQTVMHKVTTSKAIHVTGLGGL